MRKCVVYDSDSRYTCNLMDMINNNKKVKVEAIAFTENERFVNYLEKNRPELLIIGEDLLKDSADVLKEYKGDMFVLVEDESEEELENNIIFKYQSCDVIIGKIEKLSLKEGKKANVLGVYSLSDGNLRSEIAFCVTKYYANKYKILYVNLEEFSGLEDILPRDFGSLSDMFYHFSNDKETAKENSLDVIQKKDDFDYIPCIDCPEDIAQVEVEEWKDFFGFVSERFGYDMIVLDISTAVKSSFELLEIADMVIMPIREEGASLRRVAEFEKYMKNTNQGIMEKINKIIVENNYISELDEQFFENITTRNIYKIVKEAIERHEESI